MDFGEAIAFDCTHFTGGVAMKIIITQKEAADKGIWTEIMGMFAVTNEDEVWANEEFILTEEQARQVGLLK